MFLNLIIADDEMKTCLLLKDLIKSMNFECNISGCFKNGLEALNYIKSNKVDLVITDIKMPVMDGLELSKNLYNDNFKGEIIIITGYNEFTYAQKAINYGVAGFLLKPVNLDELENSIKRISERLIQTQDNSLLWEIEKYECFFLDLFFKSYDKKDLTSENLKSFGIAFPIDLAGCLFEFSVEDRFASKLSYEHELLQVAIYNILNMIYRNDIFPVFHKYNKFYFAILNVGEEIKYKINMLLNDSIGLKCDVNFVEQFNNILEISMSIIDEDDSIIHSYRSCKQFEGPDFSETGQKDISKNNKYEDEIIKKANQYMKENYSKNIGRDEVAKMLYMNPSYFSRYYKSKTGKTYSEYLIEIRMEKSIELMKTTNLNLTKISEQVGYYSRRSFNKMFYYYTSFYPKEYYEKISKNRSNQKK